MNAATVHRRAFATKEDKAQWMQEGAERDASDLDVIAWARWLAPFEGTPEREHVRILFRFVRDAIRYTKDPGEEVLDGSAVVLARGYGDCDAKARLFVALCLASGINARIDPVFRGNSFPHVRAVWMDGDLLVVVDPCIINSDVGELPRGAPITNYPERVRRRAWKSSADTALRRAKRGARSSSSRWIATSTRDTRNESRG
jgi:hypothetical protein